MSGFEKWVHDLNEVQFFLLQLCVVIAGLFLLRLAYQSEFLRGLDVVDDEEDDGEDEEAPGKKVTSDPGAPTIQRTTVPADPPDEDDSE